MAENEAVTNEDRLKLAEDYDQGRKDRADELENASEEDGEGRAVQPGAVVTGTNARGDLVTQFPGAKDRGLAESVDHGGEALRAAKGLDTGDVVGEDRTWTAQSAQGYVAANAMDVPGQTFTLDQLPDPNVVNGSGLPAHVIPEGLVVDAVVTDDINASQEAGGDVATAPRHADRVTGSSEVATSEAEASTPAEVADGTEDAKKGGRAAGRKANK